MRWLLLAAYARQHKLATLVYCDSDVLLNADLLVPLLRAMAADGSASSTQFGCGVHSAAGLAALAAHLVRFYARRRLTPSQCAAGLAPDVHRRYATSPRFPAPVMSVCDDMTVVGCLWAGCAIGTYYLDDSASATPESGVVDAPTIHEQLLASGVDAPRGSASPVTPSPRPLPPRALPRANATLRAHVQVHLPPANVGRLWPLARGASAFPHVATAGMGYYEEGFAATERILRASRGPAAGWQVVRFVPVGEHGRRVSFVDKHTLQPLPTLTLHFVGAAKACMRHYARPHPPNFTCVGCTCERYDPCVHGAIQGRSGGAVSLHAGLQRAVESKWRCWLSSAWHLMASRPAASSVDSYSR